MTETLPKDCIIIVKNHSLKEIQTYLHLKGYIWNSGSSLLNNFYKNTKAFVVSNNKVRYRDDSVESAIKSHPNYRIIYDYELLSCKTLYED
jgi:hypothetical protein